MSIYRVVISFFRDHMQYMTERGVLAMTPGEALDSAISALHVDRTRINSLKTYVQQPDAIDDFSLDALVMDCIGANMSVRDIWKRKHGD